MVYITAIILLHSLESFSCICLLPDPVIMEKLEIIKFTGKKYNSWAYQFELYLKGKQLWGHITRFQSKPTDGDKVED